MTSGNLPIAAVSDQAVRQLAQSDPVPNLMGNWTIFVQQAQRTIDTLVRELRDIDKLQETLAEHNITVDVDLGPVGNAARSTRRDLERDTGRTFEMPRAEAERRIDEFKRPHRG